MSQQNGVVERKYKYILGVAHTLIIPMHIPRYFQYDNVLFACQLIGCRLLSYMVNLLSSLSQYNHVSPLASSIWIYIFCSGFDF